MSVQSNAGSEAGWDRLRDLVRFVARIFLAAVFIYDATLMVRFPTDNMAYMQQFGIPGLLLYPTALFQFLGGLAVVFGLWLRLVALAFAAFCLATALAFHHNLADLNELIQFGKDFALAGGFLILATDGSRQSQ